jgi:hypothetical protein
MSINIFDGIVESKREFDYIVRIFRNFFGDNIVRFYDQNDLLKNDFNKDFNDYHTINRSGIVIDEYYGVDIMKNSYMPLDFFVLNNGYSGTWDGSKFNELEKIAAGRIVVPSFLKSHNFALNQPFNKIQRYSHVSGENGRVFSKWIIDHSDWYGMIFVNKNKKNVVSCITKTGNFIFRKEILFLEDALNYSQINVTKVIDCRRYIKSKLIIPAPDTFDFGALTGLVDLVTNHNYKQRLEGIYEKQK